MKRTPQEVLAHHSEALAAADLDEIVADFADDAIMITPAGVKRGKPGVREAFTELLADLPNAAWGVTRHVDAGGVVLLAWTADAGGSRADDGVDTFVVQDGMIRVQTVNYTLQRTG
jgi:ketosteroid isomerase-like protein